MKTSLIKVRFLICLLDQKLPHCRLDKIQLWSPLSLSSKKHMMKKIEKEYINIPLDDQDLESNCRPNEALLFNNAALAVVQGTLAETTIPGIVLHALVLVKPDPEGMVQSFRSITGYLVEYSSDKRT